MPAALASALNAVKTALAPKAGVDRWPVKTGSDPDAHLVVMTPVPATIAQLISLPAPKNPIIRTPPTEFTVYSVPCTIVLVKFEADGDVHLVLRDDAGQTMIAEIPNPQCVNASSPWLSQITACRSTFDAAPLLNKPVVVTGVGFFDFAHGQTGVAPNAVELHPVLSIERPAN